MSPLGNSIWCLARSYSQHASELGHSPPSEPVFFLKSATSLVNGNQIQIDPLIQPVHHEVELALQFDEALKLTRGAVGLDLTWRSKQKQLQSQGLPWTLAKSFRHSSALGSSFPTDSLELGELKLQLKVNGEIRQEAFFKQMIFPIKDVVSYLLRYFPVAPGDWLFTGTPSGVGEIKAGDHLEGEIVGYSKGSWDVVAGDAKSNSEA